MDKRLNVIEKKSAKPKHFFIIIATIVLLGLSYFPIHHFFKNHYSKYARHVLTLPKLKPVQPVESTNSEWTVIKTEPGDTMGHIFKKNGIKFNYLTKNSRKQ